MNRQQLFDELTKIQERFRYVGSGLPELCEWLREAIFDKPEDVLLYREKEEPTWPSEAT